MDLLLLAHLFADGNQDAKASSAPLWAAWIPAVIALLGTLLVAWRSGRKTDKQMELSKQATPPELTRYKEWLEISKTYKELVNFEDVDALSKVSDEYKGIEASREVAFQRAVWERKVLSACPDPNGQKRLLDIPHGVVVNGNKANFTPSFEIAGLTVIGIFISLLLILLAIAFVCFLVVDLYGVIFTKGFKLGEWDIISIVADPLLIAFTLWGTISFTNIIDVVILNLTGKYFAEYGYLRIVQEGLSAEEFKDILKSSSNGNSNAQRCIFALWDENYRNFVYCPEAVNSKFSYIWVVFKFGLPYWVVNWGHEERGYNYGEYRLDIFDIDKEEASNNLNAPIENKETYNKAKGSKQMIRRRFSRPAGCRKLKVVRPNRWESLQSKKGFNVRGKYKAEIFGINKEESSNKLDISVNDKKTYKKLIRRRFSRPAGCRKLKVVRPNRRESLQSKKGSFVRWIILRISKKWESLSCG